MSRMDFKIRNLGIKNVRKLFFLKKLYFQLNITFIFLHNKIYINVEAKYVGDGIPCTNGINNLIVN